MPAPIFGGQQQRFTSQANVNQAVAAQSSTNKALCISKCRENNTMCEISTRSQALIRGYERVDQTRRSPSAAQRGYESRPPVIGLKSVDLIGSPNLTSQLRAATCSIPPTGYVNKHCLISKLREARGVGQM